MRNLKNVNKITEKGESVEINYILEARNIIMDSREYLSGRL